MTSVALPAPLASPARSTLLVLGAVGSVQIGAALAKQLFPAVGSAGAVTLRLVTAAALLMLVTRPRVRRLDSGQVRPLLAFGAVLAVMNLSFYAALERIPLGVAVTIEFTGPLAVAALGFRRARDLTWVALAALGVVLLTGGGSAFVSGSLDSVGVALAGIAAACWAGYILLSQRVGAVLPNVQGLALALGIAAVAVAPVGFATAGTALLDPKLLAVGAAVGVLSSALPQGLEMVALRSLPAATFGVLMSLEPAVAAVAGVALLHEWLTPVQFAAIAVTCVASAGATRAARSR